MVGDAVVEVAEGVYEAAGFLVGFGVHGLDPAVGPDHEGAAEIHGGDDMNVVVHSSHAHGGFPERTFFATVGGIRHDEDVGALQRENARDFGKMIAAGVSLSRELRRLPLVVFAAW